MNYLITGFPGTGKSTIAKELKRRGHIAYDPEHIRNYMHTADRITGKHIKAPNNLPSGWYDKVGEHIWDPVNFPKLLKSDDDIFICSFAHNIENFAAYFKQIFVLTLDDNTLRNRLRNRSKESTGHSIGKNEAEISDIINLHRHFEQSLLNKGAMAIDASKPTSIIIDEILDQII